MEVLVFLFIGRVQEKYTVFSVNVFNNIYILKEENYHSYLVEEAMVVCATKNLQHFIYGR